MRRRQVGQLGPGGGEQRLVGRHDRPAGPRAVSTSVRGRVEAADQLDHDVDVVPLDQPLGVVGQEVRGHRALSARRRGRATEMPTTSSRTPVRAGDLVGPPGRSAVSTQRGADVAAAEHGDAHRGRVWVASGHRTTVLRARPDETALRLLHMRTISHRELRNNSAEVLRQVREGQIIEVTNHGEVTAVPFPRRSAPTSGWSPPARCGAGPPGPGRPPPDPAGHHLDDDRGDHRRRPGRTVTPTHASRPQPTTNRTSAELSR